MTTRPAPTLRGWQIVSVAMRGSVTVYTYVRDDSAAPQRPTAARFGAGLVREAYSDQGRTMTVRVQEGTR